MRKHLEPVRFAEDPFPASAPLSKIVKIEAGPLQQYVCVSKKIVGVWTHWVHDEMDKSKGRSMPCRGSGNECTCELQFTSLRWQGWIAVVKMYSTVQGMLCITPAAARDCPMMLHRQTNLRGMPLRVGRAGSSRQTRQVIIPALELKDTRQLPAEPDLVAFLHSLWGSTARKMSESDFDAAFEQTTGSTPEQATKFLDGFEDPVNQALDAAKSRHRQQ